MIDHLLEFSLRRRGVVRIICDNPKHKQRQG